MNLKAVNDVDAKYWTFVGVQQNILYLGYSLM